MSDLKLEIQATLSADTELIALLGGTTTKYKRIYCINCPYADEFSRVLIIDLLSYDDISADNVSLFLNSKIRIYAYSEKKDCYTIIKKIKSILSKKYTCVITILDDIYESDTKIYSKSLEIEILTENTEE